MQAVDRPSQVVAVLGDPGHRQRMEGLEHERAQPADQRARVPDHTPGDRVRPDQPIVPRMDAIHRAKSYAPVTMAVAGALMSHMRAISAIALIALLALAGCGSDEDDAPEQGQAAQAAPKPKPEAKGTTIKLGDSEFGTMLFGSNDQAIYIFENDPRGETVCYDECAEAWPPVTTKGEPQAAKGVDRSLLGTVKRDDGTTQVTYNGKPLYFYAHEGPGEVRCHNVDLNGGLWWVVGPDGKRRP